MNDDDRARMFVDKCIEMAKEHNIGCTIFTNEVIDGYEPGCKEVINYDPVFCGSESDVRQAVHDIINRCTADMDNDEKCFNELFEAAENVAASHKFKVKTFIMDEVNDELYLLQRNGKNNIIIYKATASTGYVPSPVLSIIRTGTQSLFITEEMVGIIPIDANGNYDYINMVNAPIFSDLDVFIANKSWYDRLPRSDAVDYETIASILEKFTRHNI